MPFPTIVTALAAAAAIRRKRRRSDLVSLIAVGTPIDFASAMWAITARYVGDTFTLVAVGAALSASTLGALDRSRRHWRICANAAMVVASMFSVLALPLLTIRYVWIYLFGIG